MAMVYAEAVHYFDEETDAWEEVDNCLEYSATGNRYTSNNDKFKVSFAGDKNSGELVQVLNDEYKLSWEVSVISSMSLTNLKDQKIQRKNNVSKYSIDIDQQSLEKSRIMISN